MLNGWFADEVICQINSKKPSFDHYIPKKAERNTRRIVDFKWDA